MKMAVLSKCLATKGINRRCRLVSKIMVVVSLSGVTSAKVKRLSASLNMGTVQSPHGIKTVIDSRDAETQQLGGAIETQ